MTFKSISSLAAQLTNDDNDRAGTTLVPEVVLERPVVHCNKVMAAVPQHVMTPVTEYTHPVTDDDYKTMERIRDVQWKHCRTIESHMKEEAFQNRLISYSDMPLVWTFKRQSGWGHDQVSSDVHDRLTPVEYTRKFPVGQRGAVNLFGVVTVQITKYKFERHNELLVMEVPKSVLVNFAYNGRLVMYKKQVPVRMRNRVNAFVDGVHASTSAVRGLLVGVDSNTEENETRGWRGAGFGRTFRLKFDKSNPLHVEQARQITKSIVRRMYTLTQDLRNELDPYVTKRPMVIKRD